MPDKFGWDNNFGNSPAARHKLRPFTNPFAYGENECPGHVASKDDGKVCAHCGIHIDSLRPPEDDR